MPRASMCPSNLARVRAACLGPCASTSDRHAPRRLDRDRRRARRPFDASPEACVQASARCAYPLAAWQIRHRSADNRPTFDRSASADDAHAAAADDLDVIDGNVCRDIEPSPFARHRVVSTVDAYQRAPRQAWDIRLTRIESMHRQRQRLRALCTLCYRACVLASGSWAFSVCPLIRAPFFRAPPIIGRSARFGTFREPAASPTSAALHRRSSAHDGHASSEPGRSYGHNRRHFVRAADCETIWA